MMNALSILPPYIEEIQAESFVEPDVPKEFVVVRLDGRDLATLEAVFRAYVREFCFPEYFGWNWAAFDECITSLENRPARGYVTIIDWAENVLAEEPHELEPFKDALSHAGRAWAQSFALPESFGGGEVPFHTIMLRGSGDGYPQGFS